jgi:hypothetical protein
MTDDNEYDGRGSKYLPAGKLIELLATLPPDARVKCNQVANLLVLAPDGSESLAYIDFLMEGEVVSMKEPTNG